ncbi:MAG: putative Ig domain-containing protein, partial [Acidobacteria bacterium]|nr:putative Ig domain-containing protein [Acidobacteriota bacterium]
MWHLRQNAFHLWPAVALSAVLALLLLFNLSPGFAQPQPPPDLTIRKTHASDFPIGFMGRYDITVSNAANAGPATGPITVTDNLPFNLGLSNGFGAGWTCAGATSVTCTHAGPLAAGASLPMLQLSVTVGLSTPAGTNSITNIANVGTPGETNTSNNVASDATTVLKQNTQTVITSVSPNPALNCAPVMISFAVNNAGLGGAPRTGTVVVTDGMNSCTSTLSSSTGSCKLNVPAAGAHTLTATYAGNADFNGSTSAPVTVQVNANTPPVLGAYPNTTIQVARNTGIVPSQPPRDDSAIVSMTANLIGSVQLEYPLSINPNTGVIFVTTAYPLGSYPIRVTATDDCGATTSTTFTINVVCATLNILPALLANAYRGSAYGELLRAENAVFPVKFSVASGTLPPGLTLSEDGYLSGTPTANGTFTFTVKATDLAGCVGARAYTLDQSCKALTLNPPNLIDGREGQFYGQSLEARGGLWPYTFTLQSGALPPGLSFSTESPGYLSGTPTQLGSYTFAVKVTDANGCAVTHSYAVKIECGTVTLKPETLREPVVGTAYSQQLSASGSTTPYLFSVASGTLPPGLSLSSAGLLAGTPTQGGTYPFTIKAVAVNGCDGTQRYVVGCPTITVNPNGGNVPTGGRFTASGGVAPYTFSLLGMLPYGMTFSSDGQLGGFPISGGVFPFTIKATDANGCNGTNNYVLDLTLRPTINNLIPSAVVAGRGAFTLTINGGNMLSNATLTWNGVERPVSYVNSTQLRAEISAADVAQAKMILLTVNNPPPLGSPSQVFPFTIYPSATRFEGDVWPRLGGDGAVEASDVRQMARFALKLDALTGAEFQRADCAPSQTRGDGRFDLTDVVQAQHYANGIGVLAEAGGPTATPSENEESASAEWQTQPSGPLTLSGGAFTRGQIGALTVNLNAGGLETALSFTLHYDSARLTFLEAVKADVFGNAEVFGNDTQPGKLGVVFMLAAGQRMPGGANTLLNLRFVPHGGADSETLAFTFSDELAVRATVTIDSFFALTQQALTTVNHTGTLGGTAPAFLSAASFSGGATLAPNSVVAAFGTALASANATATSVPLPVSLGGTTVTITDRTNVQHSAPLFFVSPTQINFLLPAGVAAGAATVSIRSSAGTTISGLLRVNAVAPGLFAAAANGRGLAAAQFLRVLNDTQRFEPAARFDTATGQFVAVPFEFSQAGEEVFLVLYGSGMRGRSALAAVTATLGGAPLEVVFAGNQGSLAGLDQVNLRLPRTLAGQGESDVVLTVDGRTANPV